MWIIAFDPEEPLKFKLEFFIKNLTQSSRLSGNSILNPFSAKKFFKNDETGRVFYFPVFFLVSNPNFALTGQYPITLVTIANIATIPKINVIEKSLLTKTMDSERVPIPIRKKRSNNPTFLFIGPFLSSTTTVQV